MSAAKAKRTAKATPAKRTAAKRPAATRPPAVSPPAPAVDPAGDLTAADRAEQRTDLGDTDEAAARAGRRTGPARCAAGFPIWDGVSGLCRRCIIAKRDTCAGED